MQFREVRMGGPEGRIRILGVGALSAVQMEEVESTLHLTEEQLACLPEAVERLQQEGRVVTDGPTYRLESWQLGESITLKVSRRSYFDSVLLKRNAHWGVRSRTLAVSCLIRSQDGYLIEKRSEKVAALPGRLHLCPAGSMVWDQHPLDTLEQEAVEELGLQAAELHGVECLGLVYGEEVGVFQLVCQATVQSGLDELESRACSGSWERSELLAAPLEAAPLARWIQQHRTKLTDAGRSGLVMEGMRRWGESWSEGLLE